MNNNKYMDVVPSANSRERGFATPRVLAAISRCLKRIAAASRSSATLVVRPTVAERIRSMAAEKWETLLRAALSNVAPRDCSDTKQHPKVFDLDRICLLELESSC